MLHDERFVPGTEAFRTGARSAGGTRQRVLGVTPCLGLREFFGPSEARDVALGLIYAQVLLEPAGHPGGRLHTWWSNTSLGADLGLVGIHTPTPTRARWTPYSNRLALEEALVCQHLCEGSFLCYDLSFSYVEVSQKLAAFGHSRDGKAGKRQIEHGSLRPATNPEHHAPLPKPGAIMSANWLPLSSPASSRLDPKLASKLRKLSLERG